MATVGRIVVDVDADTAKFVKGLNRSIRQTETWASKVHRVADRATKAFAAGLTAAAVGLVYLGRQQLKAADDIGKLAIRIGASTEALSEYRFVAERAGVEVNALTMGWQRMTRRIAEAANGTGEAKDALRELGLDARQLRNLAIDHQFEVIADALAGVENASDRVRLAMKLFDSEGVKLLQLMEGGADGMRAMREEGRQLGVTLSTEAAVSAAEFADRMTDMRTQLGAFARDIALIWGPAVTTFVTTVGTAANSVADFARTMGEMFAGGQGFGAEADALEKQAKDIRARIDTLRRALDPWTEDLDAMLAQSKMTDAEIQAEIDTLVTKLGELNQAQLEVMTSGRDHAQVVREIVSAYDPTAITEFAESLEAAKSQAEALTRAVETPAEAAIQKWQQVEESLAGGLITDETAQRWRENLLQPIEVSAERIEKFAKDANETTSRMGQNMGHGLADAMTDAFLGIETNFADMIKRMIVRAAVLKTLGALGGAPGAVGSFFGGFLGFQHGGSFEVGGAGGPDSQLVAFRATPGERVDVTPQGMGTGQASQQVVHQTISIQTGLPAQVIPELEAIGQRAGVIGGELALRQLRRPAIA